MSFVDNFGGDKGSKIPELTPEDIVAMFVFEAAPIEQPKVTAGKREYTPPR